MLTVAITGAGGFIGKNLMKINRPDLKFIALDLRELIEGKGPNIKIDHLVHLAAKTFVPESWSNPTEFYKTNFIGTQVCLDFCRDKKCSMTYVSSYVYGVPEYLPIDENHKTIANTPYNHSKLLAEELCFFYNKYFNVNIAILRPFNIYGPGQKSNFLIPSILEQIKKGNDLIVDNFDPKRDYLYVDDFIKAIIHTIGFKGCDFYNLGSGTSQSVKEIIDKLSDLFPERKFNIVSRKIKRENEVMNVIADNRKFRKKFNWEADVTFDEGLKLLLSLS